MTSQAQNNAIALGAIAAAALRSQVPVTGISVVRCNTSLGRVQFAPPSPHSLQSLQDLTKQLHICLAGAAAEDLLCGGVTTSSADSFARAQAIAERMIQWGDRRDVATILTEARESVRGIVRSEEAHIRRIADVLVSEGQLNAVALQQIVGGA